MPLGGLSGHLLDVGLVDGQQDVLWLDVCVDDFALGVEVVQPLQNLQHTKTFDEHGGTWCD